MLYYNNNTPRVLIGSKDSSGTRTSVTLTSSYDVANKTKAIECGSCSKVNFDILYTMGAGETSNSVEMRVEGSPDGVNYYRIPNESVSGGTSTLAAREFTFVGSDATTATISIGLDIFYKYIKISVKESGVVTNAGSIYVEGTFSGL